MGRIRRLLQWTGLAALVALLGLQLYRPEKNLSAGPVPADDLRVLYPPPAGVRMRLEKACYDCHSNHTRYPWYAEIQPLRWWLDGHVREGKQELNFSTFGRGSARRQTLQLDAIIDVVSDRTMPLPSYTWAHRDAVLDEAGIKELVTWAEELRDQIEDES